MVSVFATWALLILVSAPHQGQASVAQGWTDADACAAFFKLPAADYSIEEGGIDSCVKRYESKDLVVSVDAGGVSPSTPRSYNPALAFRGYPRFHRKRVAIDGEKGFIATYLNTETGKQMGGLSYWATLDVPVVGKGVRSFIMHVATRDRSGLKDAQAIFDSIRFAERQSN